MKRIIIALAVSALVFSGCSEKPPDFAKFAQTGAGGGEPGPAVTLRVENVLKAPQAPATGEFETFKYKNYFSIDFPKGWSVQEDRTWLEQGGSEYAVMGREPSSGASLTLAFKIIREQPLGDVATAAERHLEEKIAGKFIKLDRSRLQIFRYDAAGFEFVAERNNRKQAGFAVYFCDYYDEYWIYGICAPEKYPQYAATFKKAAESFKLYNLITPRPKTK